MIIGDTPNPIRDEEEERRRRNQSVQPVQTRSNRMIIGDDQQEQQQRQQSQQVIPQRTPVIKRQPTMIIGDEDYRSRTSRMIPDEQLSKIDPNLWGTGERSDSIVANLGMDIEEYATGFKELATVLFNSDNKTETAWEIAKQMPGAIYDSYARWYEAFEDGTFLEKVQQYPLQAVQDLTLPLWIALSGGSALTAKGAASIAKTAPNAAKLVAQSARYMEAGAKASGIAGALSDPIMNAPVYVAGKAIGKAVEMAGGKSPDAPKLDTPDTKPTPETPTAKEQFKLQIPEGYTPEDPTDIPFIESLLSGKIQETEIEKMAPINVEKSNLPDELAAKSNTYLFNELKKDDPDFHPGVRPNEYTKNFALENGVDPDEFLKKHTNSDGTINIDDVVQAKAVSKYYLEDMFGSIGKIANGDYSQEAYLEFAYKKAKYQQAISVQKGISVASGRILQVHKLTTEQIARHKKVHEMLEVFGGADKLEQQRKIISQLWELKGDTPAVRKLINEMDKPTKWDMFTEYYLNGLLSGTQTMVINAAGSGVTVGYSQILENWAQAGITTARKALKGEFTTSDFGEAFQRTAGLFSGMNHAFKVGLKTFWYETNPDPLGSKIQSRHRAAIPGVVGQVVRVPSRVLDSTDTFFKMLNISSEKRAALYRKALIAKKEDPSIKINQYIDDNWDTGLTAKEESRVLQVARVNTHTQRLPENFLGAIGRGVNAAVSQLPALKLLFPFVNTVTNLTDFSFKRIPGLAFLLGDIRKEWAKGGIHRDKVVTQQLLGAGVITGAAYMAQQGMLTGSLPTNPAERQTYQSAGVQPYSLIIGKTQLALNRLDPIALPFGITADIIKSFDYMNEEKQGELFSLVISSLATNFGNRLYMQGISDFMQAWSDPDRYMKSYLSRLVASFVPFTTFVATTARTIDPYLYHADGILDTVISRTPFMAKEYLSLRRNVLGDPIQFEQPELKMMKEIMGYENDTENPLAIELTKKAISMFNPIYMRGIGKEPVFDQMIKDEFFPGMPRKKLGLGTVDVDLNEEQYNRYLQLYGQPSKLAFSRLQQTPNWGRIPTEFKHKLYNSILHEARQEAKLIMLREFPDLLEQGRELEELRQKKIRDELNRY